MNRRTFISDILRSGVAVAILPPAMTYARTWKPTAAGIYVGHVQYAMIQMPSPADLDRIFADGREMLNTMERAIAIPPVFFTELTNYKIRYEGLWA